MRPTDPTTERFSQAEKLRQLRLQLAKTTDEPQRHVILRQIEELEHESKIQLKSERRSRTHTPAELREPRSFAGF